MSVQVQRVDFTAFRGLVLTKIFTVKELTAGVLGPYDMTGKTISLIMRDREDTPNILYTIVGTEGDGVVSFTFDAGQADLAEISDFRIEATSDADQLLQYGSANFTLALDYIPYADWVINETPPGLTIPLSYISLKTYEWRLWLQNALDPHIADIDVQNEAAWPVLANVLIAKLVVYDYMLKLIKSLTGSNSPTDERNASGIKKITTGPSDAEFFDNFNSLANFLTADKNGNTPLDNLAGDICQLANRLLVYLPMCKNQMTNVILPIKAGRVLPPTVTTLLNNKFGV